MELLNELFGKLGPNIVSFFNSPMPAQPMGWFKEEIKDASQMSGLGTVRLDWRPTYSWKWVCLWFSYLVAKFSRQ